MRRTSASADCEFSGFLHDTPRLYTSTILTDCLGLFGRSTGTSCHLRDSVTDVTHDTFVAPPLPSEKLERHRPRQWSGTVERSGSLSLFRLFLSPSTMRSRSIGLILSGIVLSSACSMEPTAPALLEPVSAPAGSRAGSAKDNSPAVIDEFAGESSTSYTVTIDPRRRNVLHFGPHTLDIPSRAICTATSGYGASSFELDCPRETGAVTITALVRSTATGIPRIDVSPAMRFSARRTVILSLYVPTLTPDPSAWRILYCATPSMDACIDEAELDPTLATHLDYGSRTLFRRIKHFSGYYVES